MVSAINCTCHILYLYAKTDAFNRVAMLQTLITSERTS